MKQFLILLLTVLSTYLQVSSQSYTSYFSGNTTDTITSPEGGACMMGGATEHDEAMKWFLERADGGDILVLRASGSDGYNDYMYSDLGVTVNSVETIVFHNASPSDDNYIHERIAQAEAIWFAGGDQWNYVSYWRDSPVQSLINEALQSRNITIGGTSAGMAILGKYYFSAINGTVTSEAALNNPFNEDVVVDSTPFLQVDYLDNVITDTHYDDPDRKGRHVTFLARIFTDYGAAGKGIACNEYTAVCIDENGLASVYGDYPNYPETAFFLQTNCELTDFGPENCSPSTPLNWDLNGTAIKVYAVNGTNNGANTFSLADWSTGSGGTWENWYVENGTLVEETGSQIDCAIMSTNEIKNSNTKIYPNPFSSSFTVESQHEILSISLTDINGRELTPPSTTQSSQITIDQTSLPTGVYFIKVQTEEGLSHYRLLKK